MFDAKNGVEQKRRVERENSTRRFDVAEGGINDFNDFSGWARLFGVKMAKTRGLVNFFEEPKADDSERDVARPSEDRRDGAAFRAFEPEHKERIIND